MPHPTPIALPTRPSCCWLPYRHLHADLKGDGDVHPCLPLVLPLISEVERDVRHLRIQSWEELYVVPLMSLDYLMPWVQINRRSMPHKASPPWMPHTNKQRPIGRRWIWWWGARSRGHRTPRHKGRTTTMGSSTPPLWKTRRCTPHTFLRHAWWNHRHMQIVRS